MIMEDFLTHSVICEGGWNSNQNHHLLSQRYPGQAIVLTNFEPSLFGGYRKISGFTPLESTANEVDAAGAEGKIYTVAFYDGNIITARKSQGSAVYKFYKWNSGAAWDDYTTGLTLTSTNVDRIRSATYNFDGTEGIAFVDGVNSLALFDGTTWVHATSADTGADFANAGGAMILAAPKYVTLFKNHIFIAGDSTSPHIVAHSSPTAEFDWVAANGAGQIIAGFEVKQLKPFRDELYVFGENQIKKIVEEGGDFVIKDVTSNLGCIAPDSIVEFNSDLLFLSQDGFRTIAATERVGDLEIAVQSKNIQQDVTSLIESADLSELSAVVIRKKSQVRFFFSDENLGTGLNVGILGAIRNNAEGPQLEWGKLLGIRASCSASNYIGAKEYVIHGDYNGKVYRQEIGTDFDSTEIPALYTTPYFDLGDSFTRKNIHKIVIFIRPEANVFLNISIKYDWGNPNTRNPKAYLLEGDISSSNWDEGLYDTALYASDPLPLLIKNVEGSGYSFSLSFTDNGSAAGSYSIQAIVFEYVVQGRK